MFPDASPSRDARDKIAQDHIRHQRQDGRRDQQFQREDSSMHDDLVNRVQNQRDDEDCPHVLPGLSHPRPPRTRIRECTPQKRRLVLSSVLYASANGEENRHRRLHQKAKTHRPAQAAYEILPASCNRLVQHEQLPVCNRLVIGRSDWKTWRLRISAKFMN